MKNVELASQAEGLFQSTEESAPQSLPEELRHLVRLATAALGDAIRAVEGEDFYKKVESYREELKELRDRKANQRLLSQLLVSLSKEKKRDLFYLAHAFSLQLEILNVCEASYRTWRLKQQIPTTESQTKLGLTYVLTAHPTEARPKSVVQTLQKIQKLLIKGVQNNFQLNQVALATQMKLLWLQSFAKEKRPSVLDEADYIYSLIFESEIFEFILSEKAGYELNLRSWVGGDKDGHPGVDENVMLQCLGKSRSHILHFLSGCLTQVQADLSQLRDPKQVWKRQMASLQELKASLQKLEPISRRDGTRVKAWTESYRQFLKRANSVIATHQSILLINKALELFPAFVLPLELREDSGMIREALSNPRAPIRLMLQELARISGSLPLTQYARGFVISHCEESQDLENACKLVDLACQTACLPVIPLFESREALTISCSLLKEWLEQRGNRERVRKHWSNRFEMMLGYSDSAKQAGVLSSRLLIGKAMHELDQVLCSYDIIPVFFHGSGGSSARGGGSLKEQIAWWSRSAVESPKMTIQGEMIQRQFATKEILNSQCATFTREVARIADHPTQFDVSPELQKLEQCASKAYTSLVNDSSLLTRLLEATPYRYLDVLKIGSRPSKRPSGPVSIESLRAIPWVLCWTQSRSLLPTWWGVGTAWKSLSETERRHLVELFGHDEFFSSYVKMLSFTLAKVELDVWQMYFKSPEDEAIFQKLRKEYEATVEFVRKVSQQTDLMWFRPWLGESIRLRTTHVHLLNLIQILAMRQSDENLLRETVVGIACGMLTTG